jgi:predicted nucleic acid-binding protein
VIILDTNVISALMRGDPEERVVRWLDQQPAQSIWITSVTLFEAPWHWLAPEREASASFGSIFRPSGAGGP